MLAVQRWLAESFKDWAIVPFYRDELGKRRWNRIRKRLNKDDLILIHSSGDFGSLYCDSPEQLSWHSLRQFIISSFPRHRIIHLPTAVYYENNEKGLKVLANDMSFYDGTKNVLLMCRDHKSYDIASAFLRCTIVFFPCFTLQLKPPNRVGERKGILLALRTDPESTFSETEKDNIAAMVRSIDDNVIVNDIQQLVVPLVDENREQYINDILCEYQKYEVVVTDRMHGMIFSVITKTKCIALDDRIPHKSSGHTPYLSNSVAFVEHIDDIPQTLRRVISTPYRETDLSSYFEIDVLDLIGKPDPHGPGLAVGNSGPPRLKR